MRCVIPTTNEIIYVKKYFTCVMGTNLYLFFIFIFNLYVLQKEPLRYRQTNG
jgi:hypothetical protein